MLGHHRYICTPAKRHFKMPMVVSGSPSPQQLQKNVVKAGPPLTKLSGSVHPDVLYAILFVNGLMSIFLTEMIAKLARKSRQVPNTKHPEAMGVTINNKSTALERTTAKVTVGRGGRGLNQFYWTNPL